MKEALGWTLVWLALALAFAAVLIPLRGKSEALQFCTGYFLELSLSVDNVFVIVLIFASFRIYRLNCSIASLFGACSGRF